MRKVSKAKIRLVVRNTCPNCKYIIKQLEVLNLLDKVEVVEDQKAEVVPAIVVEDGVEPVMGNVYGVLKIVLYMKKLGLLGLAKAKSVGKSDGY
jgi:hypothetical protein